MNRILLLLALCAVLSQARQAKDYVTITPPAPKQGEQIAVTYDATTTGAKFTNAKAIACDLLVVTDDLSRMPFHTFPMKNDGGHWSATFTPNDAGARLLLVRFVAGDSVDDHDGNVWSTMVCGADGKPVPGAHYDLALLFRGGMRSFSHVKDPEAAAEQLRLEREAHPYEALTIASRWDVMLALHQTPETKAAVLKEIAMVTSMPGIEEPVLKLGARAAELAGDSARAADLRATTLKNYPQGSLARSNAWSDASHEKDPAKKVAAMEQFLATYHPADAAERDRYLKSLVQACLAAGDDAAADRHFGEIQTVDANFLNAIAWPQIEKGKSLDRAVAWAEKGVELQRVPDEDMRASYKTEAEWRASNRYSLAAVLDTYGYGLLQQGKSEKSEAALGEAFSLVNGEDAESSTHYLDALIAGKKYDKAIETGLDCVKRGKDNEALVASMKKAVLLKDGSGGTYEGLRSQGKTAFEDQLASAVKERTEAMKKKVAASRISKPAIDFTLKDLAGAPVTLSALKGKVVVVDFWATWCGPCRSSFPYLQKVVDKYKGNDKVVFLALDTWERQKDYAATVVNAKKFIADNKYTFTVLVDEGMVDKYEVDGIPTKFLIDKKGGIAFVSVGFDGPSMEEELTEQIELLLGENIGSLR